MRQTGSRQVRDRRTPRPARPHVAEARPPARRREIVGVRRQVRQRRSLAFPEAGWRPADRPVAQPEPSLVTLLVQSIVLIVVAWVLVVYVLPALLELSAAPYR